MSEERKIILVFDAETGKVTSAIAGLKGDITDVTSEAKKTGKAVKDSTGKITDTMGDLLGKFTGGLTDAFKSASRGVKQMFPALTGLKGAIIATGVGALVVLLGELIANFDTIAGFITGDLARAEGLENSNRELDKMIAKEEFITQQLQAQGASYYDIEESKERILNLQITQKENEVELSEIQDEEEATQKRLLELEELKNEQRLLAITREQEIFEALDEARAITDKEYAKERSQKKLTKGLSEQLNVVEKELAKATGGRVFEEDRLAQMMKRGNVDLNFKKQKEEEIAELKKAEALLAERQALLSEAISVKIKEDEEKRRKNHNQKVKDKKEEIDLESDLEDVSFGDNDDFLDIKKTNLWDELQAEKESYALRKAEREEFDRIMAKSAEDRTNAEIASLEKTEAKNKQVESAKMELARAAVGAVLALGDFLSEKQDKDSKKGFEVSKSIKIASTTMSGIMGVVNALSADSVIPEPFGQALKVTNAVSIGLATATNVAKIKAMTFQGASATPSTPSGGSSPSGGGQSAPQIDFGFLQQGANQPAIQAYVLAQNVSNSTQANQLIKDQSAL
jgi:hypothetical protein